MKMCSHGQENMINLPENPNLDTSRIIIPNYDYNWLSSGHFK